MSALLFRCVPHTGSDWVAREVLRAYGDPDKLFNQLLEDKIVDLPGLLNRLMLVKRSNGASYIPALSSGDYAFAYTDYPVHAARGPSRGIEFTILRDPIERLAICYLEYCQKHERSKVSIDDYLLKLSRKELFGQLYMFSKTCDLDEALRELGRLKLIGFYDNLQRLGDALFREMCIAIEPQGSEDEEAEELLNSTVSEMDLDHWERVLSAERAMVLEARLMG